MSTHIYDPVYPSVIKSEKPAHHAITAGLVRAAVGCALGTLIIAAPAPALAQTREESPTPQTRVSEVEEQATPSPLEVAASAKNTAHENLDTSSQSQAATVPEMPGESATFEGRGFSASEAEEATCDVAGKDAAPADNASPAAESNPSATSDTPAAEVTEGPAPKGPSNPSIDEVTALTNDSISEADEVVDDGIGHGFTITGSDKETGDRYATKRSSDPSTQAILNTDKASDQLDATVTVTNHTDDPRHVKELVELPAFTIMDDSKADDRIKLVLDDSRIGVDGLTCNIPGATFEYCIVGGNYHSASYFYNADPHFSWAQITAFMVEMHLAPGQKASIDIPLIVSNFSQIKSQVDGMTDGTLSEDIAFDPSLRSATITEYPFIWDAQNPAKMNPSRWTHISLHLAKPNVGVMDSIDKVVCGNEHWLPSILVKDDASGRRYELAPEAVMQALPPLSRSDFSFSNYCMAGEHKTLFTDGAYRIHLEHAFDAISDLGYSVNIEKVEIKNAEGTVTGNKTYIWPYYSYSTFGSGNWEIPSKPTTPGDTGDGDDTGNGSTVYLEVQPIFRTRNLNLDPGDTWCPEDSLISAMACFESRYNMHVTGVDHLYNNGTYGFRLYNDDGELVAHGDGNNFHACHGDCELNNHKGQDESLTLDPGVYMVVYHYTIDPEHVVTKSATITMGDPDDPVPHTDDQEIEPEAAHDTQVAQVIETDPQAPVQQVRTAPATSEHVIPATGDTDTAATTGILGALGTLVAAAVAFVTHKQQRE